MAQVLGLSNLGIKALALTSTTPKEQITSMYQQMESDKDVRLVYGEQQTSPAAVLSDATHVLRKAQTCMCLFCCACGSLYMAALCGVLVLGALCPDQ